MRAEDAVESHLPKVDSFQGSKVTEKVDPWIPGRGLPFGEERPPSSQPECGAILQTTKIEHYVRPDWVCLGSSSVCCPGDITSYCRFSLDVRGGPIGQSRSTKLDNSSFVKRLWKLAPHKSSNSN